MRSIVLTRSTKLHAYLCIIVIGWLSVAESGCYFFRKRKTGSHANNSDIPSILSKPMGSRAGGINEQALASLHAIDTTHAPASVRPDPDVFVRRLLLQYRSSGATLAREIGRVEQYRLLLGGASEDFVTKPSLTYDATSLLAELKVAEELCQGLVAPDATKHPGWETILPNPPSDFEKNIRFLAQRLIGIHSGEIADSTLTTLRGILDTAKVDNVYTASSYIPVCTTLVVDAQALLL